MSLGGDPIQENNNTYYYVIGGSIRTKAEPDTKYAVKRKSEIEDGVFVDKWELKYPSLTGIIHDVKFKDGKFGEECQIFMRDGEDYGVFTLSTKSDYFKYFAKKIKSANLNQLITINTYEFDEPDGKVQRFVLTQNNQKLLDYFWDVEKEKNGNGFPKPEGDTLTYTKDDWKIYYLQVGKFLKKTVNDLFIPSESPKLIEITEAIYKNYSKGISEGKSSKVIELLKGCEDSLRKDKLESLIKLASNGGS